MKRTLIPLFAALAFAGTASSQNPDQPRPDGPSPERLKHEIEELRRAGKNEEAEHLEHKAREMMQRHKDAEARERKEQEARERKAGGEPEVRREKPKGDQKPEQKPEGKSAPKPEGKPELKAEHRKMPPNPGSPEKVGPWQARKEGPFAGGPMAEKFKARIEALRREGKGEQAEQFAKRAREMWAQRGGDFRGGRGGAGGGSHAEKPDQQPGERAMHLAEAAKHLKAAGIPVSPEMLERFVQRAPGNSRQHPWFPHRSQRWVGSPGGFGERPHFPSKDGAVPGAPGAGSRFDAMRRHFGGGAGRHGFPPAPGAGSPGQHPFPPMGAPAPEESHGRVDAMQRGPGGMPEHHGFAPHMNRAPGSAPTPDAVQNEIRALAQQVRELRAMIQQQHGAPNPAPMPRMPQGGQRPQFDAPPMPQAAPGGPGAMHGRPDFPAHPGTENRGEHHPHGEGRPSNPPVPAGNPANPQRAPAW
jgi:hypothetical protein